MVIRFDLLAGQERCETYQLAVQCRLFREILPNISGPIIVELTVRLGYAVFTVATLSFLGAGPKPPSPDWGAQVSDTYAGIVAGFWWPTVFPAAAIGSLVIGVSLIADSVQSVLEGS